MWIWYDNRYTCLFVFSFFLSCWMSSPFSATSLSCHFCVYNHGFSFLTHSTLRMHTFSLLLSLCWLFIISYYINEHFTLLCCTISQSKLTVLFLVIGECGGWDVIGWGPYGKHSWYLLSSLLLGNYWESSSTRGKKMFPFLFSFLLTYQFSSFFFFYSTVLYSIYKTLL